MTDKLSVLGCPKRATAQDTRSQIISMSCRQCPSFLPVENEIRTLTWNEGKK